MAARRRLAAGLPACVAWVGLAVCGWSLPVHAATDEFAQRFTFDLDKGAAYYSVTLPAVVYAASQRGDLGDLRVLNGAGEPVPFSLDTPREPPRTRPVLRSVQWFPLRPSSSGNGGATGRNGVPLGVTIAADGSLRATAAPPDREQHDTDLIDLGRMTPGAGQPDALLVHIRDDNYQGRVSIESSEDLRNWQAAGDGQLLKVTYNGSTLSQNRVPLIGSPARYLRVHWLDGAPYIGSLELEVLAANAVSTQREDAQREWREGVVARSGPKPGEYYFSTGGPYPVDRLRLNLPQPNTVAPAVVYSRASLDAPWRQVGSATLYRLHNGDVEQSNPPLELKADVDRQWRVVVDTRNGGLGAGALTVAVGWRPATLTFVARGDAPFTLAVGNAGLTSTAVSRADLLMGASAAVVPARLGTAQPEEPDTGALSMTRHPEALRRYLLWAALLLAVGTLGAIAWRLARGARAHAAPAAQGAPGAGAGAGSGEGVAGVASGAGAGAVPNTAVGASIATATAPAASTGPPAESNVPGSGNGGPVAG
ncbi:DUF3999 domain-containing protein [Paraburkholderia sp. GAS199]|uniref:DUF3999 domain-containing protein n=1 Tax=Paraburkholderia sp. GAS199 TaxID=3035126 RepID=UPI003D1BCD4A